MFLIDFLRLSNGFQWPVSLYPTGRNIKCAVYIATGHNISEAIGIPLKQTMVVRKIAKVTCFNFINFLPNKNIKRINFNFLRKTKKGKSHSPFRIVQSYFSITPMHIAPFDTMRTKKSFSDDTCHSPKTKTFQFPFVSFFSPPFRYGGISTTFHSEWYTNLLPGCFPYPKYMLSMYSHFNKHSTSNPLLRILYHIKSHIAR